MPSKIAAITVMDIPNVCYVLKDPFSTILFQKKLKKKLPITRKTFRPIRNDSNIHEDRNRIRIKFKAVNTKKR